MAGGWAGRGGDRLPHSQLPPSPTPPPRIRGAFHLLPRELRLRGSRVWSRGRDMAQQWDPTGTPLRLGVEGGESVRAVGQLARVATAGLGKGVPISPRSSNPTFSLSNWGSPTTRAPIINNVIRDSSPIGN